jgi:hypothetical protein
LSGIDKIDIIDITVGKKKILAYLDFDAWLEIGRDIGLDCDWLSKKESANRIKSSGTNYLYKYDDKIIKESKAGRYLTMEMLYLQESF